jgi:membrane protease YdiL (CAAX protease family)
MRARGVARVASGRPSTRARRVVGRCRARASMDDARGAERASPTRETTTMANLDAALGTRARDGDGAATREERSTRDEASDDATRGRADPLVAYDADRDWLGAGPRWDVPHGGARFAATMLAVDASFYAAGYLAPMVEHAARASREGRDAPESAEALAEDLRRAFDDPSAFADILLDAEIIQIALGAGILALSVKKFAPLPLGWFNDAFSSSDAAVNATGRDASKWKRDAAAKAQNERASASASEAGRAILGTFLGVALVTWVLYAAGLRGGDGNGSSSVDVIEKAFAAGPHGIANLVVTTVILAPIFEETVFRGYMLPSLTKFMDTTPAIGVSALIFALIHQHGVGDTVQLVAVGLATGIVYARTRNLAASIAVHAAFNASVIALFALWVS